jgi:hypothetical protein
LAYFFAKLIESQDLIWQLLPSHCQAADTRLWTTISTVIPTFRSTGLLDILCSTDAQHGILITMDHTKMPVMVAKSTHA